MPFKFNPLTGSLDYFEKSLSVAGNNKEIQFNNSGSFGSDNNFVFDVTSETLGVGTSTPNANKFHAHHIVTYTTITGSITSITTTVFDATVVGSGTLFLTELQVGDLLVHPSNANFSAVVTRIVSNTSCFLVGTGVSGYTGTGFRVVKRTFALTDTNTVLNTVSAGRNNPLTGTATLPVNILNGDILLSNSQNQSQGIYCRSSASDGRMRMGHIQSSTYIEFQGGNANLGGVGITLSGSSLWATPILLGASSYGSSQVGLNIDRSSATGANAIFSLHTRRYAQNGDHPNLQIGANGIDIGRRDGSIWNEGIDQINFSIDKLTGKISIGDLGTTTPTGAITRLDFKTLGETFGLKTGANATAGTATLLAGTVTINTTAITANSMIILSAAKGTVTNLGIYYESARIAASSFTINSTNILDSSTFDWHFVEKI